MIDSSRYSGRALNSLQRTRASSQSSKRVTPKGSYQSGHIRMVIWKWSHQSCHCKVVTSEWSYENCHIKGVTVKWSDQSSHIKVVTSSVCMFGKSFNVSVISANAGSVPLEQVEQTVARSKKPQMHPLLAHHKMIIVCDDKMTMLTLFLTAFFVSFKCGVMGGRFQNWLGTSDWCQAKGFTTFWYLESVLVTFQVVRQIFTPVCKGT